MRAVAFLRPQLRYLWLACLAVFWGLFQAGLPQTIAHNLISHQSDPLTRGAFYFQTQTAEELFYRSFGEMAMGRPPDRGFLAEHRGDLGAFTSAMLGPETLDGPVLPYRDYVAEYPPVNFPVIVAPAWMSEGQAPVYCSWLRAILASLCLGALYLSTRLAAACHSGQERLLWLSLLGALGLGQVFITRLDALPLFLCVGALWAAFREKPGWTGIFLALASGAKIVPIFLVPLFVAHWWLAGERSKAFRCSLMAALGVATLFVPLLFLPSGHLQAMFRFHDERPIQVESTFGLLLRVQQHLLGTPVELVHNYGSWNLESPMAHIYLALAKPLALGSVALMVMLYCHWLNWGRASLEAELRRWYLLRACGATVLALMLASKVLSPQYLIWLWPWVFLAESPKNRLFPLLCLASFLLTQGVTQVMDGPMVRGEPWGTAVLGLRNLSLLGMLVTLLGKPEPTPRCSDPSPSKTPAWIFPLIPLSIIFLAAAIHWRSQELSRWWRTLETPGAGALSYRLEFAGESPWGSGLLGKTGLGHPEWGDGRSFAWTLQAQTGLWFPAPQPASHYSLELDIARALQPELADQLQVEVNGHPCLLQRRTEKKPWRYQCLLPAEWIKDRNIVGVTLRTPTPLSPKDLGLGEDYRTLGLQMDWISLSAVDGFYRGFHDQPALQANGWRSWEGEQGPWIYRIRPENFSADLARLPVGSGWSPAEADLWGRPRRRLISKGQLRLPSSPGQAILSFAVLKSSPSERTAPAVRLRVGGVEVKTELQEGTWETIHQVPIQPSGPWLELQFETRGGPWNSPPALSWISIRGNP